MNAPKPDWHLVAYQLVQPEGHTPAATDHFDVFESRAEADSAYLALKNLKNLSCATVAQMTNNRTDWM
ncbi:hypothetical protein [uncultured Pelagimonas sp.]|uniref:hypothetical protein n=1 Tax=uncultured Pelagimonas sp. TaxID=1618102 RepID=UPI0026331242|nr:hypothetical protein [uncultured Pelagimonas sp.]